MTTEHSAGFKIDLGLFKTWFVENNYKINDIHEKEINIDNVVIEFTEPSRNKLDKYMENIETNYTITIDNTLVYDIKSVVKEYKDELKKQKDTKKDELKKQKETKKAKSNTKPKAKSTKNFPILINYIITHFSNNNEACDEFLKFAQKQQSLPNID